MIAPVLLAGMNSSKVRLASVVAAVAAVVRYEWALVALLSTRAEMLNVADVPPTVACCQSLPSVWCVPMARVTLNENAVTPLEMSVVAVAPAVTSILITP